MMCCPYCEERAINVTIQTDWGPYSMCRVCAIAWGLDLCAAAARADSSSDVQELERLWALPSARRNR
ncbi:hypothetical protein [Nitrospira sp. BLG_1]|uniref:hypothetical protein n=1 Tax=Nitrospira sp. BLG_1 TaxID=3395883 RepID=UPI0039BC4757